MYSYTSSIPAVRARRAYRASRDLVEVWMEGWDVNELLDECKYASDSLIEKRKEKLFSHMV